MREPFHAIPGCGKIRLRETVVDIGLVDRDRFAISDPARNTMLCICERGAETQSVVRKWAIGDAQPGIIHEGGNRPSNFPWARTVTPKPSSGGEDFGPGEVTGFWTFIPVSDYFIRLGLPRVQSRLGSFIHIHLGEAFHVPTSTIDERARTNPTNSR